MHVPGRQLLSGENRFIYYILFDLRDITVVITVVSVSGDSCNKIMCKSRKHVHLFIAYIASYMVS